MNKISVVNIMTDCRKAILCVGECVLDIIQVCDEFPLEDSDLRSKSGRWQRGGNASNNVTVLSLLGENCELLATYSTIDMFKFVLQDLVNRGIETKNCVGHDNCQAPLSTVLLSLKTGTRTIVHSNPNLPHLVYADFKRCQLDDYKWIHFEARNPDEVGQMMRRIKRYNGKRSDGRQIKVSLDLEKPKQDNLRLTLVEFTDYVFLGKDFAQQLGCDGMKSSVYALKERFAGHRFTVICPWGEHGAAALDADGQYYSCPAYPPDQVVDSLGAGDTFAAACIYGLSNGASLGNAIDFGSRIAGAKVGFHGYDNIKNVHQNLKMGS